MNYRGNRWMIWKKCFIQILMVYFELHISHTGGLLQNQYIGCFKSTPSATESNSKDYELTIQKCIAKCLTRSETYAALQNGTICNCVDDYGVQLPDEDCNIMCDGNQFEYCGGATIDNTKSSIYSVSAVFAVCPVGNYGHTCDEFCHCTRQNPCDRMTGNCPDGCDGQYTGPSCNTISLREKYIGCFKDKIGSRALTHKAYGWTLRNTSEMCTNACTNAGYSYAGAQFAMECFCGESYDKYGGLAATKCSSTCSGNKNTFCGGMNANSVYSICPVGRYGRGCREKCNCLSNRRCVYRSGSCPSSQCKPGWTGNSCNIRDCTAYNGDCSQNEICSSVDLKYTQLSVCRCSEGFQRQKIWENCIDKDECSEIPSVCGQNALNCINTVGGYQCLCPDGRMRINTACATDKDHCSELPSVCGQNALNCTNTIGGYQCLCPNGVTMFNTGCVNDKDECSEIPSVCGQNALNCINTIDGYQCLCPNGQRRFNTSCLTDKDECSEMSSACGRNALNCTTTIGGYQCHCPNGQTMFNATCMTEGFKGMELSNIWLIVGTAGGALLCVTFMLVVVVVIHLCRRKQRSSESTASGNVIHFDAPAIQETTYCTAISDGSTYATLNNSAYNTHIYEQIEEDNI